MPKCTQKCQQKFFLALRIAYYTIQNPYLKLFHMKFIIQAKILFHKDHMSLVMRKPAFCICKNKGANQPHDNRAADQHLCFRYKDRTIPLLPKSNFKPLAIFCGCTARFMSEVRTGQKPQRQVFSRCGLYV